MLTNTKLENYKIENDIILLHNEYLSPCVDNVRKRFPDFSQYIKDAVAKMQSHSFADDVMFYKIDLCSAEHCHDLTQLLKDRLQIEAIESDSEMNSIYIKQNTAVERFEKLLNLSLPPKEDLHPSVIAFQELVGKVESAVKNYKVFMDQIEKTNLITMDTSKIPVETTYTIDFKPEFSMQSLYKNYMGTFIDKLNEMANNNLKICYLKSPSMQFVLSKPKVSHL